MLGNIYGLISEQLKPFEELYNPTSMVVMSTLFGVAAGAWSILTFRLKPAALSAALVSVGLYCAMVLVFLLWPSAIIKFGYEDTFMFFPISLLVWFMLFTALAYWTKRVVSK